MKHVRKLTAPLSAIFLIFIAGLAFTHLQAKTEYPPPILDPEFGLWGSNPDLGGKKPMLWDLEYAKGHGDQVLLQDTAMEGRKALEIEILRDGTDHGWAYVRLGQAIDGTRLRALLDEEIGIWVYLEIPCQCNNSASSQLALFEVQANDGTHTLDFIFGQITAGISQSPTHRTILLQTPTGMWMHHPIDLIKQYRDAQWNLPDRIVSLSIIFGVPGSTTGRYSGYVYGFSIKEANSFTQQLLGFPFSTRHLEVLYAGAKVGDASESHIRLRQGI